MAMIFAGATLHVPSITGGVLGSATLGLGGAELVNVTVGVILAVIGIVTLAISVVRGNRSSRAARDVALRAEYARGKADEHENTVRAEREAEYHRSRYDALIELERRKT